MLHVWPIAWTGERALDLVWPWRPELLERLGASREVHAADGRVLCVRPSIG